LAARAGLVFAGIELFVLIALMVLGVLTAGMG
jgi:hypothetical protein